MINKDLLINFKPSTPIIKPSIIFPSGIIVKMDAINFLKSLENECADIVFLDPPFNLGKKYGNSTSKADLLKIDEYKIFLSTLIDKSINVIKPGGSLYIYHMPRWALKIGELIGERLDFKHWIAIAMKNGFVRGKTLYPAHYALLFYTKGSPNILNRPKIPAAQCRHCHGLIKDYGGYTKYIKKGINLSDFWDDLSPVRHKKHKHRAANELPVELVERIIHISGTKNGLIVDPFAGTGTTAIAALNSGMRFLLNDKLSSSLNITKQRIEKFYQNK